jgi:hypothetical protein
MKNHLGNHFTHGTNDGDFINAGKGVDVIFSKAGDDQVRDPIRANASDSDTFVFAGSGSDIVFSYYGNDVIHLGSGDDHVAIAHNKNQHDTITVYGDAGQDTLHLLPYWADVTPTHVDHLTIFSDGSQTIITQGVEEFHFDAFRP